MTLGEKLYTLRTKQNMTQEQLAEKLQVSRQSISKWESNATRPDLEKLKFLAEFYQVSLDQLLDENIDIFTQETSSDLNQNADSNTINQNRANASDASAFANNSDNDIRNHDDSASGVSPETIEKITSAILEKNHKTWKRTAIGFGTACLALTVALIVVTVHFSNRLNDLSSRLVVQYAPVYENDDYSDTSEQDTYFQSYNTVADSVSEDGKTLRVKFTAVLKNYQDNTALTLQLQNNSDQSITPVTFTYENGTYTGYADLPINSDTYSTTACIDTNGSKQLVNVNEYEPLSVLSLTDWGPILDVEENTYSRNKNGGYFMLSATHSEYLSSISDVKLQVLYQDEDLFSYTLDKNDMELFTDDTMSQMINYHFTAPKDVPSDAFLFRLSWYNSFLKQYITYETDSIWIFNVQSGDQMSALIFHPGSEDDHTNISISQKSN